VNNIFGDGDDQLYTLAVSPAYASGTNASFVILNVLLAATSSERCSL